MRMEPFFLRNGGCGTRVQPAGGPAHGTLHGGDDSTLRQEWETDIVLELMPLLSLSLSEMFLLLLEETVEIAPAASDDFMGSEGK